MAKNKKIKGITIEIGGDTKPLEKALGEVNAKSRSLQSELRQVDRLLKLDSSNVELAQQRQKLLAEAVKNAASKLDALKKAEKEVNEQFARGDIKEEQYREFRREIIRAEQNLKSLEQQAKETSTAVNKMGDNLKDSAAKLENAGDKLKSAGDKMSGVSAVSAGAVAASVTGAASLESAANKTAAATDNALGSAEEYRDLIKDIYSDNFGEGFEDIADKVALVKQQMNDIDDSTLEAVVKNSYALQDAFDVDFNEGLRGANALMKQFKISAGEAYDLMLQGAQKGLNQNQDLADQVSEYATYFSDMGYTADEMFNIMASGAEKGIYQIDYLNDAMKEFSIRTIAGDAQEALTSLGFDAVKTQRKIAEGGREGAAEVTKVIEALSLVNDEVLQNQYGVELFGTKWEDSGREACLALADVNGAIQLSSGKLEDAMNTMYSGASAEMQTALREIAVAGTEIGESVLPTIAECAKAIAECARAFSGLPDGVKQAIVVILLLIATIAPLLSGVGSLVGMIGKLVQFFGEGAAGAKILGGAATALGVSVGGAAVIIGSVLTMLIALIISITTHTREWKDFAIAVFTDIGSLLPPWLDGIKSLFNGLPEWAKGLGKMIILGLAAGITGNAVLVIAAIGNLIASIKKSFTSKQGLDIHSPSKWGYGIGGYLGEGFVGGFKDSIKGMQSAIDIIKSGFDMPALSASSTVNYAHSGVVTIKGVNNRNEAVYSTQLLMSDIADELARERRRR